MPDMPGDKPTNLEEEFFRREDQKLIARQRELQRMERTKEDLSRASGIQDPALLQRLVDLNVSPQTVVALALIPLIEVAWADGEVDAKEREAVLAAAREEEGLDLALLESWLGKRPPESLLEAWRVQVRDLTQGASAEQVERLRRELLERARSVAKASGGLLGLGSKVSPKEEAVLRKLEQAFES